MLINLHRARQTELPYRDFFIWGDDTEYTDRLSADYGGAARLDSMIVHESPAMESLGTTKAIGWKYRYLVRNNLSAWWGRDPLYRAFKVAQIGRSAVAEVRYSSGRLKVLRTTVSSIVEGLTARHKHYPIGSLLAESAEARAWVERARRQPTTGDGENTRAC